MAHPMLLRGGPGAGKTEVAKRFAEQYGWQLIELDAIKRERWPFRRWGS